MKCHLVEAEQTESNQSTGFDLKLSHSWESVTVSTQRKKEIDTSGRNQYKRKLF